MLKSILFASWIKIWWIYNSSSKRLKPELLHYLEKLISLLKLLDVLFLVQNNLSHYLDKQKLCWAPPLRKDGVGGQPRWCLKQRGHIFVLWPSQCLTKTAVNVKAKTMLVANTLTGRAHWSGGVSSAARSVGSARSAIGFSITLVGRSKIHGGNSTTLLTCKSKFKFSKIWNLKFEFSKQPWMGKQPK
jgi:hypothetical protein